MEKTYPIVSVIIPTKNEEENILKCLASIKRQEYKGRIEIILVDNHSQDKTLKLAKPYVSRAITAGPERSTQRNIGANEAKGDWLLFIDADMELLPGVIKECVALTQNGQKPKVVAIYEKSEGFTFWGRALALERNCYQGLTRLTAARFFPRNHFLRLGGYDERMLAGEDWDITLRFKKSGFGVVLANAGLVHYEPRSNFRELLKKELYYIKNIKLYAQKHPQAFSQQASLTYRIRLWGRYWKNLSRQPLLTLAFLWYKFTVWLAWQWYRIAFHRFL